MNTHLPRQSRTPANTGMRQHGMRGDAVHEDPVSEAPVSEAPAQRWINRDRGLLIATHAVLAHHPPLCTPARSVEHGSFNSDTTPVPHATTRACAAIFIARLVEPNAARALNLPPGLRPLRRGPWRFELHLTPEHTPGTTPGAPPAPVTTPHQYLVDRNPAHGRVRHA